MTRPRRSDAPPLWRLGDGAAPKGPHLALVPGAEAPLLHLDLPDRLRGMARERVAQRQVTEALGSTSGEIEMRPFAPGGRTGAWSSALIVSSEAAQNWRAALAPGCIALLPDYLALPCAPEVWTVQTEGDSVMVRLGPGDGFSAEPDLAQHLLARALDANAPRAVLRLGPAEPAIDDWLAAQKLETVTDPSGPAKLGARPLRWVQAAGGIDLKDPPRAIYDRLHRSLTRWRAPAIVAGLALALWLGALAVETRGLAAQADRASALTRDLVRQHFVPQGPILNIRAQVQAVLDAAATPASDAAPDQPPLTLFQRAAPLLSGPDLTLETVDYRPGAGLVAAILIRDFATLETVKGDLRAAGFVVEDLDSRARQSGGIAARLRLIDRPRG